MRDKRFRTGSMIRPVAPPPPDSRTFVRQFVPPAGSRSIMVAIHQHVLGYHVHFLEGRTVPCIGSPAFCEGCRRLQDPRWEGYIGVVLLPSRSVRTLKVTVGAYRHCPALEKRQGQLRGLEIVAERMGRTNNSPLRLHLAQPKNEIVLPPMWPMQETLARLWGYSQIGDIERSEQVQLGEVAAELEQAKGGEL